VQLFHHQTTVERTQQNEMLLTARGVLSERSLSTFLECGGEKSICAIPAFVGP
jgi:hypothetical protein